MRAQFAIVSATMIRCTVVTAVTVSMLVSSCNKNKEVSYRSETKKDEAAITTGDLSKDFAAGLTMPMNEFNDMFPGLGAQDAAPYLESGKDATVVAHAVIGAGDGAPPIAGIACGGCKVIQYMSEQMSALAGAPEVAAVLASDPNLGYAALQVEGTLRLRAPKNAFLTVPGEGPSTRELLVLDGPAIFVVFRSRKPIVGGQSKDVAFVASELQGAPEMLRALIPSTPLDIFPVTTVPSETRASLSSMIDGNPALFPCKTKSGEDSRHCPLPMPALRIFSMVNRTREPEVTAMRGAGDGIKAEVSAVAGYTDASGTVSLLVFDEQPNAVNQISLTEAVGFKFSLIANRQQFAAAGEVGQVTAISSGVGATIASKVNSSIKVFAIERAKKGGLASPQSGSGSSQSSSSNFPPPGTKTLKQGEQPSVATSDPTISAVNVGSCGALLNQSLYIESGETTQASFASSIGSAAGGAFAGLSEGIKGALDGAIAGWDSSASATANVILNCRHFARKAITVKNERNENEVFYRGCFTCDGDKIPALLKVNSVTWTTTGEAENLVPLGGSPQTLVNLASICALTSKTAPQLIEDSFYLEDKFIFFKPSMSGIKLADVWIPVLMDASVFGSKELLKVSQSGDKVSVTNAEDIPVGSGTEPVPFDGTKYGGLPKIYRHVQRTSYKTENGKVMKANSSNITITNLSAVASVFEYAMDPCKLADKERGAYSRFFKNRPDHLIVDKTEKDRKKTFTYYEDVAGTAIADCKTLGVEEPTEVPTLEPTATPDPSLTPSPIPSPSVATNVPTMPPTEMFGCCQCIGAQGPFYQGWVNVKACVPCSRTPTYDSFAVKELSSACFCTQPEATGAIIVGNLSGGPEMCPTGPISGTMPGVPAMLRTNVVGLPPSLP